MDVNDLFNWGAVLFVIGCIIGIILFFYGMIFGLPYKTSEGQYVGYVTGVEQNGMIFKGWTVYLKTDLASSQEDVACINRNNQELINKLKEAQNNKESVKLNFDSNLMYGLGECPGSSWMIKEKK